MIKCYTQTISPIGVDGSATASAALNLGHAGFLRAISVDFQNEPATTTVVIKDSGSGGTTLMSIPAGNTDIVGKNVATDNIDEAGAAGVEDGGQGLPFTTGLYTTVALGDAGATKKIVFKYWVER